MPSSNTQTIKSTLKQWAHSEGFDHIAITTAKADARAADGLQQAIRNHWHGDMIWLAETMERRADPQKLWPKVQSVIMLAMNYGPDINPLTQLEDKDKGLISVYARHRDYHDVIKGKLKQMAGKIAKKFDAEVKVFVDTAPVMEKPLAQRAGLGWQGKHTNMVSKDFGSWLFLGSIFTDLVIDADEAETDHCGSCRACLDICPTKAFPAPYQLDATRCISYLTIEHQGPIPTQYRKAMGNRIYGCDDCLAVCPWNKFAQITAQTKLQARPDLMAPSLGELANLDDAHFRKLFSGSPIKRIGRDRFIRNVLVAIGNAGLAAAHNIIVPHLIDPNPLVRGAAVWALAQSCSTEIFEMEKTAFMPEEKDDYVCREWQQLEIGETIQ